MNLLISNNATNSNSLMNTINKMTDNVMTESFVSQSLKKEVNDPYIETPWSIIESYFRDQHLERLVRHQLESYNNFVGYQIIKTIEIKVHSLKPSIEK